MSATKLDLAIQEIADLLHNALQELLPTPEGVREDRLFEAMRYVSLSHGKRLRPFLTVISARLFRVSDDCSIQTAAAVELLHAYSLVHDDLPSIDNDDWRRGLPSCHKKFDEATAILCGDALLTYAFEILSDSSTHSDALVRIELVNAISKAAGFRGMVGGQILDIAAQSSLFDFAEIVRLQRMKTGALFAISCEAGAILGKAPHNLRSALKAYATNIGLAFQITDDLLDAKGTREETGKAVGKDASLKKATLIACLGIEQAMQHTKVLAEQAIDHLSSFDSRADILRDLAYYVVTRTK